MSWDAFIACFRYSSLLFDSVAGDQEYMPSMSTSFTTSLVVTPVIVRARVSVSTIGYVILLSCAHKASLYTLFINSVPISSWFYTPEKRERGVENKNIENINIYIGTDIYIPQPIPRHLLYLTDIKTNLSNIYTDLKCLLYYKEAVGPFWPCCCDQTFLFHSAIISTLIIFIPHLSAKARQSSRRAMVPIESSLTSSHKTPT